MVKEMLFDFYMSRKIKSSMRFVFQNIVLILFVMWIFAVFYYNAFQIVKGIDYVQTHPEYVVLSYFVAFLAHCGLVLFFSKFYKEQDYSFFTQTPLKTSIMLKYMATKNIVSLAWLPIVYGVMYVPFSWHINHSLVSTFLYFVHILLLYTCFSCAIYLIKSSLSIRDSKYLFLGVASFVFLLLITYLTAFASQFFILYLLLLTILAVLLWKGLDFYLIKNEKDLLISIDNEYSYKKRKTHPLYSIIKKVAGSKSGIVFFEFFSSELLSGKNITLIITAVLFSVFYVFFIANYPPSEEARKIADVIAQVVFVFIQLVLAGILELRVHTQNWFYYKTLPISFLGKFFLDYVPYLAFAFLMSLLTLLPTFLVNWRLGIVLLLDIILVSFLMWHISFAFLERRFLTIIFGFVVLGYIVMKILSPFLLLFVFSLFAVFILHSNKKKYISLEIQE